MSSVYQYSKLNRRSAAESGDGVESGSYGTPCVQHIVHKDDVFSAYFKINAAPCNHRILIQFCQVVPVESYVQFAHRYVNVFDELYISREGPGKRHAAALDTEEYDIPGALIVFEDLMSHAL